MSLFDRPYGYERALTARGFGPVAGADEAGRGACAGPLVAAAVIIPDQIEIAGLKDSKLLTPAKREKLFDEITGHCQWGVVSIGPAECDQLGMQEADLQALRRAILRLSAPLGFALTDGFGVAGLPAPGLGMWKGDRVCACISAASVLAKVTRDRYMVQMAEYYPGYAFEVHKGYATALHQKCLNELGPSPIHRLSYANVRKAARLSPS